MVKIIFQISTGGDVDYRSLALGKDNNALTAAADKNLCNSSNSLKQILTSPTKSIKTKKIILIRCI